MINKIKNIFKFLFQMLEIDIVRIVIFFFFTVLFLIAFVHRISL